MTSKELSTKLAGRLSLILLSSLSSWVMAADEPGIRIEEITVTATHRATNVQSTAAAISALSSDDMAVRSIGDIESLGQLNASTDVSIFQGEAQIYIRGIGYSGIIGGTDSSTALHIDGVYMSRSSAAVPGFFDVERVEVVRGPQGTLYGRNATSGSVNIITKKPTDELEIEASFLTGDYGRFKTFGAISGPIGGGVNARLAIQREKRDGYTTLIRPVADPVGLGSVEGEAENKDDIMARLTLQFEPSENIDVTLTGDYYEADDAGSVWLYLNRGTGSNQFLRDLLEAGGHFLPEPYSRRIESDIEHFNRPKIWGLTSRVDWDLNDYRLTSLTAYKETNPLNRNDLDSTGGFGVDQVREEDHQQFSQEIQLISPADTDLEWILGLYYFNEKNDVRNEYFLPFVEENFLQPITDNCCLLRLNGTSEAEAYALFGEATYDLSENLELLVGGRFSSEERGGANDVTFQGLLGGILANVAEFEDEKWTSFTPKVGLNYQLNEDIFVYGTISEGFKSGGFNIGSYQNTPFDPEEILSYELGAKADLLDNRLRLNSAIFYYDYTDLQIQDVEANNTIVRNAANAIVQGIEIEGTSLLSEALQLDFSVTYLDAEFRDVMLVDPKADELGIQNLEGNRLPRAPELKYVLGLEYTWALDNGGSLIFRGDYKWQDDVFFSAFNVAALTQESYDWAKARVAYQSPEGNWGAAIFMDNITDQAVATNATYNGSVIDSTVTGNMAPPKTFGLELNYQF